MEVFLILWHHIITTFSGKMQILCGEGDFEAEKKALVPWMVCISFLLRIFTPQMLARSSQTGAPEKEKSYLHITLGRSSNSNSMVLFSHFVFPIMEIRNIRPEERRTYVKKRYLGSDLPAG